MRKAFAILTALAALAAALTGCATSPPVPLQVTHLAFTKWRHDGAGNVHRTANHSGPWTNRNPPGGRSAADPLR